MNYTEKTKLVNDLCGAGLMLLLFEVFYGLTDSAFTVFNYNLQNVESVIYILGGIILAISVVILAIAFKKDRPSLSLYGVELLVLAVTAALLPGTYLTFTAPFNKLNKVFPIVFLVYYMIKIVIILANAFGRKGQRTAKRRK